MHRLFLDRMLLKIVLLNYLVHPNFDPAAKEASAQRTAPSITIRHVFYVFSKSIKVDY
jgi:hypothetical protein